MCVSHLGQPTGIGHRVSVAVGAAQVESVLLRVALEPLGAGLVHERRGGQITGELAVGHFHPPRHHVVEQVRNGTDQQVEGAGDQYCVVTGRAMLFDPREGTGSQPLLHGPAQGAVHELLHTVHGDALVAAQERADELSAVSTLGLDVRGGTAEQFGDLAGPLHRVEFPAAQLGVLGDDVAGHHCALEVEDRHHIGTGRERTRAGFTFARGGPQPAVCAGHFGESGQVHVLPVIPPVDGPRIEVLVLGCGLRQRPVQSTGVGVVEDHLGARVVLVQVHVGAQ